MGDREGEIILSLIPQQRNIENGPPCATTTNYSGDSNLVAYSEHTAAFVLLPPHWKQLCSAAIIASRVRRRRDPRAHVPVRGHSMNERGVRWVRPMLPRRRLLCQSQIAGHISVPHLPTAPEISGDTLWTSSGPLTFPLRPTRGLRRARTFDPRVSARRRRVTRQRSAGAEQARLVSPRASVTSDLFTTTP